MPYNVVTTLYSCWYSLSYWLSLCPEHAFYSCRICDLDLLVQLIALKLNEQQ